eukprot:COSAG04_NODE_649_length_11584_cov_241.553069_11_plen_75_part_00
MRASTPPPPRLYRFTAAARPSLGYLQGSMDHWTQAEDAAHCGAGICPMQPNHGPGLPNVRTPPPRAAGKDFTAA